MITDTYIALSPSPAVAMARVMDDPLSPARACAHLANGGDLVSLATAWGVRYSDIAGWLSRSHTDAYRDALRARGEWGRELVTREIAAVVGADIRRLYDEAGSLLPPAQWPDDVARAVQDYQPAGETSAARVRMIDKLGALEMLGKLSGVIGSDTAQRVKIDISAEARTFLVFPDGHPGSVVSAEQAPTAQVET